MDPESPDLTTEVIRVLDGGTITVEPVADSELVDGDTEAKEATVRLQGIDILGRTRTARQSLSALLE